MNNETKIQNDDQMEVIMDKKDIQEMIEAAEAAARSKDPAKHKEYRKEKSLFKKMLLSIFILLALVLIVLVVSIKKLWDERVVGDEILFGECIVTVGDNPVEGKRSFIRPYTDLAGMRFVNPNKVYEKILMENHNPGLIVVSMKGDESEVVIFDDEQGINLEIPLGEKYLFVNGSDSTIISHADLCN